MDEKRRYPRLKFNVDVEYKILRETGFNSTKAESKNIGAGGICIIALEKFDIGNSLSLKFSLPGAEKSIKAIGKVAWVSEFSIGNVPLHTAYDTGIEFTDINDEDREKINEYVITQA